MIEDAKLAAKEAAEKLGAKSVEPGKYDWSGSYDLYLTIHESAGHPTELDRSWGMRRILPGRAFLRWTNGSQRSSTMAASW